MNKTPKNLFLFLFLGFLFSAQMVFAQTVPQGMQTLADNILAVFTSNFVKVILAIFLCGSAVGFAFNKDNEKIKRNFIAIGVATGILVVAQQIVTTIWNASGG